MPDWSKYESVEEAKADNADAAPWNEDQIVTKDNFGGQLFDGMDELIPWLSDDFSEEEIIAEWNRYRDGFIDSVKEWRKYVAEIKENGGEITE